VRSRVRQGHIGKVGLPAAYNMRILHVIYDDIKNPWVGGGGATRTLEIYSRIARRGHEVLVICGNYPGAPPLERRGEVRYRHVGYSRSYILSRIAFMLGAVRYIRRGDFDIVVEDVSPFSPIGSPIWKQRVPHVASVQNLLGLHATQKFGVVGWGPRLVEKELLQMYRSFVAVSPGIARQIEGALGRSINCRVIPNSCNPIFFQEREMADGRRWTVDGGQTTVEGGPSTVYRPPSADGGGYILSLGRIDVYQKGLDDLVNAFDRMAECLPDIRLFIAGSGMSSQVEILRGLVEQARHKERVELLGQVDQHKAAKLMRGALLVAIPSRYEGWPLAALEAGAVGVPVVGSNIVGVRDAAPQFPAGHGELVDPGDIAGLSRALYRVASDRKLRTNMASRGSKWARGFSWDMLAEEQMRFYLGLLGKKA
jgi:glycosyltransferase involved in cell wall biosynthesis